MTIAEVQHHKFNVDDFYKIYDAGVFHEDQHIELLNGEILEMTPIGTRHRSCVDRINRLLSRNFPDEVILSIQNPVRLDQSSEPEPDIAVLKYRDDFYAGSHPQPEDVFLIIEVADSSIDYDRDIKLPLYVRARIPEVWIVNLNENCTEAYSGPASDGYESKTIYQNHQSLAPRAFPDVTINVKDIIPGGEHSEK